MILMFERIKSTRLATSGQHRERPRLETCNLARIELTTARRAGVENSRFVHKRTQTHTPARTHSRGISSHFSRFVPQLWSRIISSRDEHDSLDEFWRQWRESWQVQSSHNYLVKFKTLNSRLESAKTSWLIDFASSVLESFGLVHETTEISNHVFTHCNVTLTSDFSNWVCLDEVKKRFTFESW